MNQLPIVRLKFECIVQSSKQRPSFLGAEIRKAIGLGIRSVIDCNEKDSACSICGKQKDCLYLTVFKPNLVENLFFDSSHGTVPAPFSIEVSNQAATDISHYYNIDERFMVKLNLFSKQAIDAATILTAALIETLESFVLPHGFLKVAQVSNALSQAEILYHGTSIKEVSEPFLWTDRPANRPCSKLRLNFNMPLALSDISGKPIHNPTFPLICRSVGMRISNIFKFYSDCEYVPQTQDDSLDTKIKSGARFIHMKHKADLKEPRAAVLGVMVLDGELTPLLSQLILGSWLHIGKAATFGYGGFSVKQM